MSRVREVTPKVEYMLQHFPLTRSNDKSLIRMVYSMYYGVDYDTPFGEVMRRQDLPSFESIRRARQKLQEMNEDLRGTRESEIKRMAEQEEYLEYAREGV